MIVPRRAFADVACYRCDPMGAKPTTSRPSLPAQFLLLPVALFALAACATPGAPGGTAEDKPLYPGSQSNVASLSEVITAHPDDPQAYNMRGSVYGEAGRPEITITMNARPQASTKMTGRITSARSTRATWNARRSSSEARGGFAFDSMDSII